MGYFRPILGWMDRKIAIWDFQLAEEVLVASILMRFIFGQHFSYLLQMGRIVEVSANLDWVDDGVVNYDYSFQIHVRTENGLMGNIIQDVVTKTA